MKKIVAVIVWFNPKKLGIDNIVFNIHSYLDYFDKIYIVDNSESDNSDICEKLSKYTYLKNKNKGGIAGAQNLGCKEALKDGFEWVMTLDQDSSFNKLMMEKYIFLFNKYSNNDEIVSFGTEVNNLNEYMDYLKWIRKKIFRPIKRFFIPFKQPAISEIEYKTFTIASGNIINLNAWSVLGGFDEYLFIEEVDSNFCHRIIRSGKKIAKFPQVILDQCFGEKKKFTLFPKLRPIYTDFRYFYVFRNKMIECLRFPEYKKSYKKHLKCFFIDYCINTVHPIKHLRVYFKARKEFKIFKKKYYD